VLLLGKLDSESPANYDVQILTASHSFIDIEVEEPKSTEQVERLADAVSRLTEEVCVVRDVLDEIREDLGWVTRNGIPGQPTVHTHFVRMVADPFAPDANERLEFRQFTREASNFFEFASDTLEGLISEIAEVVTGTGQEQVDLLLSALDDLRAKLLAAIKSLPREPESAESDAEVQPPVGCYTDR